MKVQVHRTYFQMRSPAELRPSLLHDVSRLRLARIRACPAHFYRYLYREVGRQYAWRDRSAWSDPQIIGYLSDAAVSLHVLYADDVPAGYFELCTRDEPAGPAVEIVYFGLLPHAIGRGLGKHLLTLACRQAWEMAPHRLWLHTCSLDHPAAMPNYLARGFQPYRQETYEQDLPGKDDTP